MGVYINGIKILSGRHSDLSNLDYTSAGHTGFSKSPVYDYIRLSAGSASVPDTNPANYSVNILSNGFPEISVGYSTDSEEAYWVFLMPTDWTGGTGVGALTAIIEWATTNADVSKKAIFEIWGKRIAAGVSNTTSLDLLATTTACLNGGVNFNNNTSEVNLGSMAGSGRKIQLMIKRDKTGEAGDTIPAEVKVTAIEIKYQKAPV